MDKINLNRRQIITGTLATLFARLVPLQLPSLKYNEIYINEDIRKWGIDQIDETTMREIFRSGGEIKRL
jgi:hypothetical protein